MRRFFVEKISSAEKAVFIKGKELHHLRDVLRLKNGDEVIVFDGKGGQFTGKIEAISRDEARILIEKMVNVSSESPFEIILCHGIAKGEKMDIVIQKATELGVSRIIPFLTPRVVSRLQDEKITRKVQRWQNIAIEAAKQCGRVIIPKIEEPLMFMEILRRYQMDNKGLLKIIPWEGEKKTNLKDILKRDKFSGCVVLIGPEGGFSDEEISEALKGGFLPITLGPRILRTETAGISIIAILQYELGDMGG